MIHTVNTLFFIHVVMGRFTNTEIHWFRKWSQMHECLAPNYQTNITDTRRNRAYFAESVGQWCIPMLKKEHNTSTRQFPDLQEHAGFLLFP